jgi:very-short-patch-repair endonuclease
LRWLRRRDRRGALTHFPSPVNGRGTGVKKKKKKKEKEKTKENMRWEIMHRKPRKPDYINSFAKEHRKKPTKAEAIMWERLRNRQFYGLKFRRQVPFGRYIMDFYCKEKNLCLEIDGSSHDGQEEYDSERETFLKSAGICVMRFSNDDVEDRLDVVLKTIVTFLNTSPSPVTGRGKVGEGS